MKQNFIKTKAWQICFIILIFFYSIFVCESTKLFSKKTKLKWRCWYNITFSSYKFTINIIRHEKSLWLNILMNIITFWTLSLSLSLSLSLRNIINLQLERSWGAISIVVKANIGWLLYRQTIEDNTEFDPRSF